MKTRAKKPVSEKALNKHGAAVRAAEDQREGFVEACRVQADRFLAHYQGKPFSSPWIYHREIGDEGTMLRFDFDGSELTVSEVS